MSCPQAEHLLLRSVKSKKKPSTYFSIEGLLFVIPGL